MILPRKATKIITKGEELYPRTTPTWIDLRFEGREGETHIINSGTATLGNIAVSGQKITKLDKKIGTSCWNCGDSLQKTTIVVPNFTHPSSPLYAIDFYLKMNNTSTGGTRSILTIPFVSAAGARTFHFYMEYTGGNKVLTVATQDAICYAITGWNPDTWYNIVLARYSNKWTVFTDGNPIYSWTMTNSLPSASDTDSTKTITIGPGENNAARSFLIDHFRIRENPS